MMQANNIFLDEMDRIKILVVDDDPNFLFAVSRMLMKAQFNVITASDGVVGITKAQAERPDLIILDVNMPGLSGFEVRKILGTIQATKDTPVVFLSAMNDDIHTLDGLRLADDYIAKPCKPEVLVARLKALIRRIALGYKLAIQDLKNPDLSIDQYQHWSEIVEAHEYGTLGHTRRVTDWFILLATLFGLAGDDLENGKKGAILHDIGKLAIPESILNKPGPLNETELQIVQQHPLLGYEMLSPLEMFRPALPIIRYHHEHWDGEGYPDHLEGERIPKAVRLFSIVDVFDSLQTGQPYRAGMTENEAMEIIRAERGRLFDPEIADFFLSNFNFLKNEVTNEHI